MKTCDLVIIGGGPAGLATALGARKQGIKDILIVERDKELGGILNQCIHNGFGLHTFKEELTGPEYAGRYIEQVKDAGIPYVVDSMVLSIQSMSQYKSSLQADQCEYNKEKYSEADQDKYCKKKYTDKIITMVSRTEGIIQIQAKAVILAMGCRERPRGALNIPGYRPAGIYSAGTAQRLVNMEGYLPGREVVILGSGDIGLIMARRMSLEGAKVVGCVELCPYSNGLNRNIVQCLNDYDIPLYLSHTITDIQGDKRVEKVIVSKVDEKNQPIPGTEMEFDVDTVLLSVGLIPENELTRSAGITMDPATSGPVVYENMETSAEGIFASGNVVHVHDLVDFVTAESQKAGKSAAEYVKNGETKDQTCIDIKNGDGVNGIVPQKVRPSNVDKKVEVMFRARNVFTDVAIKVRSNGEELASFKREHMAPGEMEKIVIPKAFLDKVENGEITVSVEKVGA